MKAPPPRPELAAGDGGALRQRSELRPDNLRIHAARSDVNAEAAVDAGHHVVAADELRISLETLRDELGMLDVVGLALDDAGDQHLALRRLDGLEQCPILSVWA